MIADLYHYTCDHGHQAIGAAGSILPGARLTDRPTPWPARFVWLTDLERPLRQALGLTSYVLSCDRTRFRYRATDTSMVAPWWAVARHLPREVREELEGAVGARPAHWYVSAEPVPVVFDPLGAVA